MYWSFSWLNCPTAQLSTQTIFPPNSTVCGIKAGHTGAPADGTRIPDGRCPDPGRYFWGIAPASQWSWVESVVVFYERGEPSEVHGFRYSATANPECAIVVHCDNLVRPVSLP
jgi:hypothetical protein